MTLCELQTAESHSIPLECEVFLEEGGLDGRTPHGVCVERVHPLETFDLFLKPLQSTFQKYSVLGKLFWIFA